MPKDYIPQVADSSIYKRAEYILGEYRERCEKHINDGGLKTLSLISEWFTDLNEN